MSSCKVARIHPSSTGIVRPEEGKLKLEYGYVSDQQAEAATGFMQGARAGD